jgi:hypothetical protein
MDSAYNPPLSLTIIGAIFIGLATLVAAWITLDIVIRRGWQTMMAVMYYICSSFPYSANEPIQDSSLYLKRIIFGSDNTLDVSELWKACQARQNCQDNGHERCPEGGVFSVDT